MKLPVNRRSRISFHSVLENNARQRPEKNLSAMQEAKVQTLAEQGENKR